VKLSQVLTNLIGNAIKFTERGSVTVAAEAREITETAIAIEFSVTDTGIGIPAEKQAHILRSSSRPATPSTKPTAVRA
jgi:signal transduction histidine kinase